MDLYKSLQTQKAVRLAHLINQAAKLDEKVIASTVELEEFTVSEYIVYGQIKWT